MAVPYTFGSATAAIPLSQLDSNFATTITLGNTAVQLGNTITTLNNMTLGNVTVSSGNVVAGIASSTITQSMLAAGVAGNGPAFSAYRSTSDQSVTTTTWTALSAQTKEFDTATAYNNTGSTTTLNGISVPAYSFAPNVAGYYQVNGEINATCTAGSQMNIAVYKNGSEFKRGFAIIGGAFSQYCSPVSALIYMNGTSDYVTLYGIVVGTSPAFASGAGAWSYFQANLVRSA